MWEWLLHDRDGLIKTQFGEYEYVGVVDLLNHSRLKGKGWCDLDVETVVRESYKQSVPRFEMRTFRDEIGLFKVVRATHTNAVQGKSSAKA